MTRLWWAACCALALAACGRCGDEAPPPETTVAPLPPVPAPAGLAAEIVVSTPVLTLNRVRDAGGTAALFLPRTVGGLATNLFGLPLQAAELVDEQLPVLGATQVDDAGAVTAAIAVHIRDRERFVQLLTAGPDARFAAKDEDGIVWLDALPTLREARVAAALAMVDQYLVAGHSRGAISELGRYLTRTLSAQKRAAEDVTIALHPAAFGVGMQKRVERLPELLAALQWPPALDVLVDRDAIVAAARSLLDDVGGGRIGIRLGEAMIEIDATLTPRDAAAAQRLAQLAVADPRDMARLPDDTLAALSWSESVEARRHGSSARADKLGAFFGTGWTREDTKRVSSALDAIASGRGDHTTLAVRCTGVGVTGMTLGDVRDGKQLRDGLAALIELRKHAVVKARLDAAALSLSAQKTRILEVPHDVWRIRLTPTREGANARLEAIDLLYLALDDRFAAAAGMETVDTVQHLDAPREEAMWSQRSAVGSALERLPHKSWLSALVDPLAIDACMSGTPGGALAMPIAVAAGPKEDAVVARLEIARPLIRLAIDKLGL